VTIASIAPPIDVKRDGSPVADPQWLLDLREKG
jgi:hypothetical protein